MIRVFEAVAEAGLIRLPVDAPSTAHCLVTILEDDVESLRQQSQFELPEVKQLRMSELLVKNREGALTPVETRELDALAEEFDAATLTKGSALAALARLNGNARPD